MKYFLILIIILFTLKAQSQPGSIDTTFNLAYLSGANDDIICALQQTDGKILIGGLFTSYNDTLANRLARLNSDGMLDTSFNIGIGINGSDPSITGLAIQPDGKIIITGVFESINGQLVNNIARLNSDGSIDTAFVINLGSGAWGNIRNCAIQDDGKIVIVGGFTYFNWNPMGCITRLNSDGTIDQGFNIGIGADTFISTVNLQSDGKIIIAGGLTSFNGVQVPYIARLETDGTLDPTFSTTNGPNSQIETLSLQSDGKIIIGGVFTQVNGVNQNFLSRLNTDGTLDISFNIGIGANSNISMSAIQSDDKILIVGDYFNSFNGYPVDRFIRLNADGGLDTTFNFSTAISDTITAMTLQTDGKVLLLGKFNSAFQQKNVDTLVFIQRLNGGNLYSIDVISCGPYEYNSQQYIESGTYTQSYTSVFGIDSTIQINLTIDEIDVSISNSGGVYTSNQNGADYYQWISCSDMTPIMNENYQTFTPTENGDYAVIITNNNCSDTSLCFNINNVSINEINAIDKIYISPNPGKDIFNIFSEIEINRIEIYNTSGVLQISQQNENNIDMSKCQSGLYLVYLYTVDDQYFIERIIKN